ncbi:hypothetical protein [Massilia sp. KIM]|uniref:hypothetical protein n=1 Tax=Massilia sp. KIM TaxID=1955422 RepID=UPI00117C8ABE|nr:hypothetical protein [Massilia sp. KIM]
MQHTLVAVFDNRADAQSAMNELLSSGFSSGDVRLSNADPTGQTDSITGASDIAGERDMTADRAGDGGGTGIGASIKHFFSDLFGSDNDEHVSRYEGAVTRGHHVLTLTAVSLVEVERAADIVERYGPTDIDEQASQFGDVPSGTEALRMGHGSSMGGAAMSAQSGGAGQSLQAGGQPTLDNPGDRKLFQQQSLNQAEPMGTTYQEPMGKSGLTATGGTSLQGSTLQENSVQASSLDGTQQTGVGLGSSGMQGGTLRSPDQGSGAYQGGGLQGSQQRDTSGAAASTTPGQRAGMRIFSRDNSASSSTGSGMDDDVYYRDHYSSNYADSGKDYDTYKSAYTYGREASRSELYRNRPWDEVQPQLQSDWDSRNASSGAGSTWENMKDAVRHGWNRLTDDDDAAYRKHWSATYGADAGSYDEYRPAYSYGEQMRRNARYSNRQWDEAESDLRMDWESRNPNGPSTWEKMKSAVRQGWDKMTT